MFQPLLRTALVLSAMSALAACTVPAQETSLASPIPPPADNQGAALSARGEYLVRIAGCNDCHTPRLKKIWACHCGAKDCTGTMLKPKR